MGPEPEHITRSTTSENPLESFSDPRLSDLVGMMLPQFGGVFLSSALPAVGCAQNDLGKPASVLVGRTLTGFKLTPKLNRPAVSERSSTED